MIKADTGLFLFPFTNFHSLILESCKIIGALVYFSLDLLLIADSAT